MFFNILIANTDIAKKLTEFNMHPFLRLYVVGPKYLIVKIIN